MFFFFLVSSSFNPHSSFPSLPPDNLFSFFREEPLFIHSWVKDLFGWTDEVEVTPEEENQTNTEESIVIEESAEGSETDEVLQ